MSKIVDIQVDQMAQRLRSRRIALHVDDAARTWLAEHGYDPAFGARPLRRLIQREIGDRLARMIIGGEAPDGGSVTVQVSGDELKLEASA